MLLPSYLAPSSIILSKPCWQLCNMHCQVIFFCVLYWFLFSFSRVALTSRCLMLCWCLHFLLCLKFFCNSLKTRVWRRFKTMKVNQQSIIVGCKWVHQGTMIKCFKHFTMQLKNSPQSFKINLYRGRNFYKSRGERETQKGMVLTWGWKKCLSAVYHRI